MQQRLQRLKFVLFPSFDVSVKAANEPYERWSGMDRRSKEYKALKEERADALWKVGRCSGLSSLILVALSLRSRASRWLLRLHACAPGL